MLITITTGKRFAADYPAEASEVVYSVQIDDQELDPEDIWHAANQVDDVEADCASYKHGWQRSVRRALVSAGSTSMSVGDTIELCSDTGTYLGGWKVERSGFSVISAVRS